MRDEMRPGRHERRGRHERPTLGGGIITLEGELTSQVTLEEFAAHFGYRYGEELGTWGGTKVVVGPPVLADAAIWRDRP